MRTITLSLVLINVCFLFWSQYIDTQSMPAVAANTATSSAPRLMLATERSANTPTNGSATAQLGCIGIGPFSAETAANQVLQRLQTANYAVILRTEHADVFAGYWVSLPSVPKRGDADQALERLHASGVNDAYLLPDEDPPNVISLGLFTEQAHAERRRDEVAQLGFQPQLQTRTRVGDVYWLDVSLKAPGQRIDPALLQPENSGIVRLETKPCAALATNSSSAQSQG